MTLNIAFARQRGSDDRLELTATNSCGDLGNERGVVERSIASPTICVTVCSRRYRCRRRSVSSGVSWPSVHALVGSNPEVGPVVSNPTPSVRFSRRTSFPLSPQPRRLEVPPHGDPFQRSTASLLPTIDANAPVLDCAIKLGNRCFQRDGRIVANRDRPRFLVTFAEPQTCVCLRRVRPKAGCAQRSRLRPARPSTTLPYRFSPGSRCPQHLHIGAASAERGSARRSCCGQVFRAVALAAPTTFYFACARHAMDGVLSAQ